jgi:hypothetical protein
MSVAFGRRILPCLLGAGLIAACSDGSAPNGTSQTTLSFTKGTGASPAPSAAVAPSFSAQPVTINGQTLAITQVQVVLSRLELERADHAGTCLGESVDCQEFSAGPVLVDLPVDAGVTTTLSTAAAEGTYGKVELKVDVPDEDDAATTAFLAAHPSWPQSSSVHVAGTFDANDGAGPQPFDAYLSGEAELEMELNPPVVVDATGTFNVTVAIDPNAWFLASGGSLIDPRAVAANTELQASVWANIDSSFHVFEDDDKDGVED